MANYMDDGPLKPCIFDPLIQVSVLVSRNLERSAGF